jgi:hypothetical protein
MDLKAMPMLRKNLKAFIMADPRSIVVFRPQKTETDNGSWTEGSPEELEPQIFRLTPMKRRLSGMEVTTQDGSIPIQDEVLVGFHTADIQADDEFDLEGDHYKVVQVVPKLNRDRDKADRVVAQLTLAMGRHDGDGFDAG